MNRALDLFRFDNWKWPFMEEQRPQLKLLTPNPDPEIKIEAVESGKSVSGEIFLITEKGKEPLYVEIACEPNKLLPSVRERYTVRKIEQGYYSKKIIWGTRHYELDGFVADDNGKLLNLSLEHQRAFQDYFWKTKYEPGIALAEKSDKKRAAFDELFTADPSLMPYQPSRGRPRPQERTKPQPTP